MWLLPMPCRSRGDTRDLSGFQVLRKEEASRALRDLQRRLATHGLGCCLTHSLPPHLHYSPALESLALGSMGETFERPGKLFEVTPAFRRTMQEDCLESGLEVMLPDCSSLCWHPEGVGREPSGSPAHAPLSRAHGPSPTIANPTFLSPSAWTDCDPGPARGALAEHSTASHWVVLFLDARLAQRLVGFSWPHSR